MQGEAGLMQVWFGAERAEEKPRKAQVPIPCPASLCVSAGCERHMSGMRHRLGCLATLFFQLTD
jgi:hypothetical protein